MSRWEKSWLFQIDTSTLDRGAGSQRSVGTKQAGPFVWADPWILWALFAPSVQGSI